MHSLHTDDVLSYYQTELCARAKNPFAQLSALMAVKGKVDVVDTDPSIDYLDLTDDDLAKIKDFPDDLPDLINTAHTVLQLKIWLTDSHVALPAAAARKSELVELVVAHLKNRLAGTRPARASPVTF